MTHCFTWIQEFSSILFTFAMERDNSDGWNEEDTKNEKKNPHSGDIVNEIDPRKFKNELVEEIDFRKCKSDETKNLPCDDSLEYIDLSKYKTFSKCRPWESTSKGRNAGNDSRPESSFRSRNGGNDEFENLDSRELANRIYYAPHKDLRKFKSNEHKILPCDGILEKSDRRKHQPNDEQHSTFGEWDSWGSTYNGKNARNKSRLEEPTCRNRNEGGSGGFNNLNSRELANRITYVPQKELKGFKRDADENLTCDDILEKIDLRKYKRNEQDSSFGEWPSWKSTCNGRNAQNKSRHEPSVRSRTEGGRDGFENFDSRELASRIKSAPRKDVFDRFNYGRNAGNEPRLEAPLRNRNERENEGFENLDSGELTDRLKYTPPKGVFDQRSYAYDVEASDIARKRRECLLSLQQSFSTGWTTTNGLLYQSAF